MKRKIAIVLLAVVPLVIILALFVLQLKSRLSYREYDKKMLSGQAKRMQAIPALQKKISQIKPRELSIETSKAEQASAKKVITVDISNYLKEFDIPEQLKLELLEAAKRGNIDSEWGKDELAIEERYTMDSMLRQAVKHSFDTDTRNITAGHRVVDRNFDKMLAASLPVEEKQAGVDAGSEGEKQEPEVSFESGQANAGVKERQVSEEAENDEEIEELEEGIGSEESSEARKEQKCLLKSEALSMLGFSAAAEFNYEQAKEAFRALIQHYPDAPSVPIVRLEYAYLLFEEGAIDEAREAVDEAIYQHYDDKEYVEIAEGLKDVIQSSQ